MKFERLIASRFLQKDKSSYSRPLVNIATWSIALGVLVMLMAVCILRGFQAEIKQKVVGFGSHIIVKSQDIGHYYEEIPITTDHPCLDSIRYIPGVAHIQFYASKGGMAKTDDQIQGIIFKGVDSQFDSTFFAKNLVEGRIFRFDDTAASNEVIISRTIANKLGIQIDDKLRTYFWSTNTYRARAFKVVGIYNTDLAEFDEHYVVGDLRQVQALNEWATNQVAGYEILVDHFDHLPAIAEQIYHNTDYDLTVATIVESNQALFSWLDLLNSNIVLILVIMGVVCCVAIISALLIMIFEKTSMIGLLKTLGANDTSIRRIFLIKSLSIVGKGILTADAIALALCLVQQKFHIVHLDSESYSMNFVPIDINAWVFVLVSIGTLVVCLLALLVPASYIARIHPAKTLKFE